MGSFHGIGTFRAKEVVDIRREHLGVGQHDVIGSVVLSCGVDHLLRGLEIQAELLNLLQHLSGLTCLCQQSVLYNAGVTVQKCRGFGAEVAQNLKTFVAYAA